MRGGCCSRPPISTAQARLELRALIKARNSQEAAAQSVSASRVSGRNETSIETSAGLNRQGARLCTERHDGWWPGVALLQGSQTGLVGHAGPLRSSPSSLLSALCCVQGRRRFAERECTRYAFFKPKLCSHRMRRHPHAEPMPTDLFSDTTPSYPLLTAYSCARSRKHTLLQHW